VASNKFPGHLIRI